MQRTNEVAEEYPKKSSLGSSNSPVASGSVLFLSSPNSLWRLAVQVRLFFLHSGPLAPARETNKLLQNIQTFSLLYVGNAPQVVLCLDEEGISSSMRTPGL